MSETNRCLECGGLLKQSKFEREKYICRDCNHVIIIQKQTTTVYDRWNQQ